MKLQLFKIIVDFFDTLSYNCSNKLGLNPKRKILEMNQDLIPVSVLEKTIGKSLGL